MESLVGLKHRACSISIAMTGYVLACGLSCLLLSFVRESFLCGSALGWAFSHAATYPTKDQGETSPKSKVATGDTSHDSSPAYTLKSGDHYPGSFFGSP